MSLLSHNFKVIMFSLNL